MSRQQLTIEQPVSLGVALNATSPTGALGCIIWSTTTNSQLTWNGTNWIAVAGSGGGGGVTWATYTGSASAPSVTASTGVLALNFGGAVNSITETGTPYGALYLGGGNTVSGASDRNIMIWGGLDTGGTSTQRTLTTSAVKDTVIISTSDSANRTAYSNNVVIGSNTNSTNTNNVIVGSYSSVIGTGTASTTVGYGATTSGGNSTALGAATNVVGNNTVAVGYGAQTGGAYSIAIGVSATTYTSQCLAIGYQANSRGSYSLCIGYQAGTSISTTGSIAIGNASYNNNAYSIALGNNSTTDFIGEISFSVDYQASSGDRKTSIVTLHGNTTNATALQLGINNAGAGAPNTYIKSTVSSGYVYDIRVVGNNTTTGGNVYIATYQCAGYMGATASTFVLGQIQTVATSNIGTTTGWSVAITADTTNGGPKVTVTGPAAANVSWAATVIITKAT